MVAEAVEVGEWSGGWCASDAPMPQQPDAPTSDDSTSYDSSASNEQPFHSAQIFELAQNLTSVGPVDSDFIQAVHTSHAMLISPIEVLPIALTLPEMQLRCYRDKEAFAHRRGPRVSDFERLTATIDYEARQAGPNC